MSQVPGSPFDAYHPLAVAFSRTGFPRGRFLAATISANPAARTSAGVAMFSVAGDGSLSQVAGSPFAASSGVGSVAFWPGGSLLAAAGGSPNGVSLFYVNDDGTLRPVPGSPFSTGPGTAAVAFSPDGRFLVTANSGTTRPRAVRGSYSVYSVQSSVSEAKGSPFFTDGAPTSLAFAPDRRLLAAASPDGVYVFSVSVDGTLSQVAGSPFAFGGRFAETDPRSVAFSPDGGLLVTANDSREPDGNDVWVFSVAADGALTELGPPLDAGGFTKSVAFSPSGELLTVLSDRGHGSGLDGEVSVFRPASGFVRKPLGAAIALRGTASSTAITGGRSVTFTLRAANPNWVALRHVRTCDALPSGLVFEAATPRPRVRRGQYCWTVTRLASGRHTTYKLTARTRLGASGALANRATATATDAQTARARVTVHVAPRAGLG